MARIHVSKQHALHRHRRRWTAEARPQEPDPRPIKPGTLRKWQEGVAELEAKLAQRRKVKHYFVDSGLEFCEACGAHKDQLMDSGVGRIHFAVPAPIVYRRKKRTSGR